MIYVDYRVGSDHYLRMFQRKGVEVERCRLSFGDVSWLGNGATGQTTIGIEVKRPFDLIQSFVSKRLTAHQIPGMLNIYEFPYLAIVGRMRRGEGGGIEVEGWDKITRRRDWAALPTKVSWRQIQGMLLTLRHLVRVQVVNFDNDKEFVEWATTNYLWWQREWNSHRSHISLRVADRVTDPTAWMPVEQPLPVQVASLLPGIGNHTAISVGKKFTNLVDMVNASTSVWEKIPGVGKKRAAQAFLALRGE